MDEHFEEWLERYIDSQVKGDTWEERNRYYSMSTYLKSAFEAGWQYRRNLEQ